jgi:hypothetical protein
MSLIIYPQNNIPNEVTHIILSESDLKAVAEFRKTCRCNSNIILLSDDLIKKIFSQLIKTTKIEDFVGLAPQLGKERIFVLNGLKIKPTAVDQLAPFGIQSLHLTINGPQDGSAVKEIKNADVITTLSIVCLRTEINGPCALELFQKLKNVSKLHIGSIQWLSSISEQFPSVKEVDLQLPLSSKTLTKLFDVFPNVEKLSLPSNDPDTKVFIVGKEHIENLAASLKQEPLMNPSKTNEFIMKQTSV